MTLDSATDEALAWLTLLRAPGLGAGAIRALVTRHGSARSAVERSRHEESLPSAARDALSAPDAAAQAADRRWLDEPGHHLLTCVSEDFPALLRDIPSAPAALFVAGDPIVLW